MEEGGRKWKRVAANVCIAVWLSMARPAGYVGCSMDLWTITGVWRALGFARGPGQRGDRRGADSQNCETVRYDVNLSDIGRVAG